MAQQHKQQIKVTWTNSFSLATMAEKFQPRIREIVREAMQNEIKIIELTSKIVFFAGIDKAELDKYFEGKDYKQRTKIIWLEYVWDCLVANKGLPDQNDPKVMREILQRIGLIGRDKKDVCLWKCHGRTNDICNQCSQYKDIE